MLARWFKDILLFKSDKTLSFLLAFLALLLFGVFPFADVGGIARYVVDATFASIFVSAALVVERRPLRQIALALMVITVLTRWATYASPSRELLFANTVLGIAFLVLAVVVILARVFAPGPVTRYRVEGAVAAYLLIGLAFSSVYALVLQLDYAAIGIPELSLAGTPREVYDGVIGEMTYFSFATLTTVGYGDITPQSAVAKQFAVLEGLIGQLYPAILLARLVSQQVASQSE